MYKSIISPQQSTTSNYAIHNAAALHKKSATTTQSKLAEYIKGASKGKVSVLKQSNAGYASTIQGGGGASINQKS